VGGLIDALVCSVFLSRAIVSIALLERIVRTCAVGPYQCFVVLFIFSFHFSLISISWAFFASRSRLRILCVYA